MVAKSTSNYTLPFIRFAGRCIYFYCFLNNVILNWFNRSIAIKLNLYFLFALLFHSKLTHSSNRNLDGSDISFKHIFNDSRPIFGMENGYTDFDLVFVEVIDV